MMVFIDLTERPKGSIACLTTLRTLEESKEEQSIASPKIVKVFYGWEHMDGGYLNSIQ
jgi:hypothetical protein